MKIPLITLMFALLFMGCSDNIANTDTDTLGEWKIQGFSQKGPFISGSTVNIMELDGKTKLQTGRMFKSAIKTDKGDFTLEGDSLSSKYVMIEVNGYYRNEITGNKSSGPLTLNAITDLSNRKNVNINLLTHLEFERIRHLVSKGKSITEAKTQAEGEIFSTLAMDESSDAFEDLNIFKSGNGNAKLLAISILMQSETDIANFTDRIGRFAMEFAQNGTWNDKTTRNAIAEWAFETEQYDQFEYIRENILAWGISDTLPDFEKYINMFWADNYGLGKCSDTNKGDTAVNVNSLSPHEGLKFVCDGTLWKSTHKGTSKYKGEYGTLTDERDGHTYKTVQIGEQVWMAENLNYDYQTDSTHSMCHENKQENCDAYGRLYTFAAAIDSDGLFGDDGLGCGSRVMGDYPTCNLKESSRGVCPEGWHLPSKGEWEQLFATVGGEVKAAKVLRMADDTGTDEYGFNSYSAGLYAYGFDFLGDPGFGNSHYWTSTPNKMYYSGQATTEKPIGIGSTYLILETQTVWFQVNDLGLAFAVRCVKD